MIWSSWHAKFAQGTGNFLYNNCKPNCAQGMVTFLPSTVVLRGRERCRRRYIFRHLKVTWQGGQTSSKGWCPKH